MTRKKLKSAAEPAYSPEHYQYAVRWSDEDGVFIARVAEFPSLGAHGGSQVQSLRHLRSVVAAVLDDMTASGEEIPEPFSKRTFSGSVNLRMPAHLHRRLVAEAAQQGVSLNQWMNLKLEEPAQQH
jgi:predicted HicB family RNase H-like nuclease